MKARKIKGFTLIELIVVIAIIGVLAAILVPAMMGYITSSKIRTSNSNAKTFFTNCQTVCQTYETVGVVVSGNPGWDGSAATEPTTSEDVDDYSAASFVIKVNDLKTGKAGFAWTSAIEDNVVLAVAYSDNGATHAGGYPYGCHEEQKVNFADVDLTDVQFGNGNDGATNATGWDKLATE